MKFSILIANYNNSRYLKQSLDSVISQTTSDIEVIVVDDHSSDDSWYILEEYSAKYPNFSIYKNDTNKGAGFTKKKCIDKANGEICGFLDPDDALELNAVELMLQFHLQYPNASLIYSSNYVCDENLNVSHKSDWVKQQPQGMSLLEKVYVGHFATFKRSLYLRSIHVDPTFKRAVDHDLYLSLESVGDMIFIDVPLYYYRHHPQGLSLYSNKFKAEYWDWLVKHRHAQNRGENLEIQYMKTMEDRLDARDGRIANILVSFYKSYLKITGR